MCCYLKRPHVLLPHKYVSLKRPQAYEVDKDAEAPDITPSDEAALHMLPFKRPQPPAKTQDTLKYDAPHHYTRMQKKAGKGDTSSALFDRLSPREFQVLLGEMLKKEGYMVESQTLTRDGGVDLLARHSDMNLSIIRKVVIQAKKWAMGKNVGEPAIRDLIGTIELQKADYGLLITTSGFTANAEKAAFASGRIRLIDRGALVTRLADAGISPYATYEEKCQAILELCRRLTSRNIKEIKGNLTEKKKKKYISELYVQREALENEVKSFLHSDAKCFAVVGEAGVGKTNLACRLTEILSSEGYPTIFYNAYYLSEGLERQIDEDMRAVESQHQSMRDLVKVFEESLRATRAKPSAIISPDIWSKVRMDMPRPAGSPWHELLEKWRGTEKELSDTLHHLAHTESLSGLSRLVPNRRTALFVTDLEMMIGEDLADDIVSTKPIRAEESKKEERRIQENGSLSQSAHTWNRFGRKLSLGEKENVPYDGIVDRHELTMSSLLGVLDEVLTKNNMTSTRFLSEFLSYVRNDKAIHQLDSAVEQLLGSRPIESLVKILGIRNTRNASSLQKAWQNLSSKLNASPADLRKRMNEILMTLSLNKDLLTDIDVRFLLAPRLLREAISAMGMLLRPCSLVIVIDAINESPQPSQLKIELANLMHRFSDRRVKFIITCRDFDWRFFAINNDRLIQNLYPPYQAHGEVGGSQLLPLSEEELARCWRVYKAAYELKGGLTPALANMCKHPLMLRILAEAYEGNRVPEDPKRREILDRYWERKMASTGYHDLAERHLFAIVQELSRLNETELPMIRLQKLINETTDKLESPLARILSEGILVHIGVNSLGQSVVRFTYEMVHEYTLARFYIHDDWSGLGRGEVLKRFRDLLPKARSYPPLRGALQFILLFCEGKLDDIHNEMLAILSSDSDLARIVPDTIGKLERVNCSVTVIEQILRTGENALVNGVIDSLVAVKAQSAAEILLHASDDRVQMNGGTILWRIAIECSWATQSMDLADPRLRPVATLCRVINSGDIITMRAMARAFRVLSEERVVRHNLLPGLENLWLTSSEIDSTYSGEFVIRIPVGWLYVGKAMEHDILMKPLETLARCEDRETSEAISWAFWNMTTTSLSAVDIWKRLVGERAQYIR